MPWKMSSLASAATSTTFPILTPSLVTTASPVLTAVHAICSSAMRLIIEPVQLGGLDRRGLAEDEQEDRLTSEALRLVVHGDRPATARNDERRCCSQRQLRSTGALVGHRLRRRVVESVAPFLEFRQQRIAGEHRGA